MIIVNEQTDLEEFEKYGFEKRFNRTTGEMEKYTFKIGKQKK